MSKKYENAQYTDYEYFKNMPLFYLIWHFEMSVYYYNYYYYNYYYYLIMHSRTRRNMSLSR